MSGLRWGACGAELVFGFGFAGDFQPHWKVLYTAAFTNSGNIALQDTQLLNSQTGAYQPVEVALIGRESIDVAGEPVVADRYSLNAEGLDLDLWYTPEGEWLALTSTVEKGRQLRYELVRT